MSTTTQIESAASLDATELSQLSDLTSQREEDQQHHLDHTDTSSINWESLEFT
eukprot:CAMPEP_0202702036 /NCGR_PEP_ID=MMETSP1385-20130828/15078_1 /ASSEMBLY_ACC=CAM_ASM_000861 /TAXON_ID=933848 /ORGANISM="Elphidium margaritaceum" /LENGTH=52 /DNA_ID=CAMNT_0049359597 /DNA_START=35 /DNA_END=189 /DNA_ORIENTATION=+